MRHLPTVDRRRRFMVPAFLQKIEDLIVELGAVPGRLLAALDQPVGSARGASHFGQPGPQAALTPAVQLYTLTKVWKQRGYDAVFKSDVEATSDGSLPFYDCGVLHH